MNMLASENTGVLWRVHPHVWRVQIRDTEDSHSKFCEIRFMDKDSELIGVYQNRTLYKANRNAQFSVRSSVQYIDKQSMGEI